MTNSGGWDVGLDLDACLPRAACACLVLSALADGLVELRNVAGDVSRTVVAATILLFAGGWWVRCLLSVFHGIASNDRVNPLTVENSSVLAGCLSIDHANRLTNESTPVSSECVSLNWHRLCYPADQQKYVSLTQGDNNSAFKVSTNVITLADSSRVCFCSKERLNFDMY